MIYLNQVREFHEKYNVPFPSGPTFTPEVVALRIATLEEERQEFMEALAQGDRLEMLDAICDFRYFHRGTVLAFGLGEQYTKHADSSRNRDIKSMHVERQIETAIRAHWLGQKIKYLAHLANNGAINSVVTNLFDQECIVDGLIDSCGFRDVIESAFAKVHQNNMQKLFSREQMLAHTGDYTFTDSWIPDMFIARDAMGKIRKPPGFVGVDLTEFVK